MTELWLKLAGIQALVVWHSSQTFVLETWAPGLPVAVPPLWQLEHWPVTEAWLKLAGIQALVVWHSSQTFELETWAPGLPVAVPPLWQLEH